MYPVVDVVKLFIPLFRAVVTLLGHWTWKALDSRTGPTTESPIVRQAPGGERLMSPVGDIRPLLRSVGRPCNSVVDPSWHPFRIQYGKLSQSRPS